MTVEHAQLTKRQAEVDDDRMDEDQIEVKVQNGEAVFSDVALLCPSLKSKARITICESSSNVLLLFTIPNHVVFPGQNGAETSR